MTNKTEAALRALASVPSLHPDFHQKIVDALHAEGVLDGNGGAIRATAAGRGGRVAKVEAAAATDAVIRSALRYAGGQLRQCGVGFDDIINADIGEVSIEKLNAAMANKPVEFRMGLKSALAAARLID